MTNKERFYNNAIANGVKDIKVTETTLEWDTLNGEWHIKNIFDEKGSFVDCERTANK